MRLTKQRVLSTADTTFSLRNKRPVVENRFIGTFNVNEQAITILFPMSELPTTVSDSCYARVGLMGNPSDGFKGKTLSFLLENFKATVHISEKLDDSRIELAEPVFFDSLDSLFAHSQKIVSYCCVLSFFVLNFIGRTPSHLGLYERHETDASDMQSFHRVLQQE